MGKFMKLREVVLILAGCCRACRAVMKNIGVGDGTPRCPVTELWWLELTAVLQSDSCHGQEENHQEVKDQLFVKVTFNYIDLGQNSPQQSRP